MKKWRCTVCNYIHTGETPPEVCPVCGADRTKFVEISEEEAKQYEQKKKVWVRPAESKKEQPEPSAQKASSGEAGKREADKSSGFRNFVDQQLVVHHAHPVVVHVPNGVLPIVVLFMFLSAILGWQSLAWSAFSFTLMVVISMPVVFYTGFNVWIRKYNGARTSLFMIKIAAAVVVATTSVLIVLWYFINPDVIYSGAAKRGSFLFLNLVMLGATGVAGYIGGKLVFKD